MSSRARFWQRVHVLVNDMAWRFAPDPAKLPEHDRRLLWRLNDWLGDRWIDDWMRAR